MGDLIRFDLGIVPAGGKFDSDIAHAKVDSGLHASGICKTPARIVDRPTHHCDKLAGFTEKSGYKISQGW